MARSELTGALTAGLPAHAELVDRLASAVERSDVWRWLEVGCSVAAGRADALSDIDAGVGHVAGMTSEEVETASRALIEAAGPIVDHLAHRMAGRPDDMTRLAVEYRSGVQLDLVVMPAESSLGLPDVAAALVDKDGDLSTPWTPTAAGPPLPGEARQWTMLGWWAISDATKYVRRGSLFEAVQRIDEARTYALQLFAVGRRIAYPSFGLTSLLDYPPFELPAGLEATYCPPVDAIEVVRSIAATATVLDAAANGAGEALGVGLTTTWSDIARGRLAAAQATAAGA